MTEIIEAERCQECGGYVQHIWHAPDAVWEKVTGSKDRSGSLCLRCFDAKAEELGIMLYWECCEDKYPTFFPDAEEQGAGNRDSNWGESRRGYYIKGETRMTGKTMTELGHIQMTGDLRSIAQTALEALAIIALGYKYRIDKNDKQPYIYAQEILEQLGVDLEVIKPQVEQALEHLGWPEDVGEDPTQ